MPADIFVDTNILVYAHDRDAGAKLSFWDGLILAAARKAGVNTVWSEHLNPGQDYAGIYVVNPLD